MKTLKLEKLKGKKLTVFLVEKEYNEPFYLLDSPLNVVSKNIHDLFRPSESFCSSLEELIKKINPDFALEELGMRNPEDFDKYNKLTEVFKKHNIPFYYVDIDEYAKSYFAYELYEKREFFNSLNEKRTSRFRKNKSKTRNTNDYLESYIAELEADLEENLKDITFRVREKWIVMGLLEKAAKIKKKDVTCFYICSPMHLEGVKTLLSSLGVNVTNLQLKTILTYADKNRNGDLAIIPVTSESSIRG